MIGLSIHFLLSVIALLLVLFFLYLCCICFFQRERENHFLTARETYIKKLFTMLV